MKICIIGDPYGTHDIGERKVVSQMVSGLTKNHEILVLKPKDVLSIAKLRELRNFAPEIVHYWAGPRFQSLIILWIFKKIAGARWSLNTAIRPQLSRLGLWLGSWFKPDLILAQSQYYLLQFRKSGYNVAFLSNGVDTTQFYPVEKEMRNELRKKHSIPQDRFVILHVGHLTPWRSLHTFVDLGADQRNHVLIIGSTSLFKPYVDILASLRSSGCDVRCEFFPNISELYQLADCFVFPGGHQAEESLPLVFPDKMKVPAIEIPLSVIEARACGVPIVTSRFGGLNSLFANDQQVYFFDQPAQIVQLIERIRHSERAGLRDDHIKRLDWDQVSEELETNYARLASA
jgi:glycosyltransferase involved in cell wall biosynthesis